MLRFSTKFQYSSTTCSYISKLVTFSSVRGNIKQYTTEASNTAPKLTNNRPEPDKVLQDIAHYVHNISIDSQLAKDTAKLCLLDTLGCGLAALKYPHVQDIIKPIVPGTVIPNGTKVFGTNYVTDPVRGAFVVGTLIRWLDFNDCWLAKEWGHPSDNLGGILPVADYMTRLYRASNGKEGKVFSVDDILECMIKAHEIQGIIALDNSLNEVGLDHVALVKIATTAVVSKMLQLSEEQTIEAVSHAFVDGQPLRTYRHAPNTGSRKSWAAGDAVSRAVNLAFMVKNAGIGTIHSVLTARKWGVYDVLFNGKPFIFDQKKEYGSYVMENVLFKISFPAEFHAQTAVEAGMKAHRVLLDNGRTYKDIKSVRIRTQQPAIDIIDKVGPLYNYADRDHCIQYMTTIPLIYGRLEADDYMDAVALLADIDVLRNKIYCIKDAEFTKDYYNPEKRSIANALLVELNDGTFLDEIVVEYPIGHKFRREEGIPLLLKKFRNHLSTYSHYSPGKADEIYRLSMSPEFGEMAIDHYIDQYCIT
ncbi:putative 2-methylcitrate dehydratase NDAI_0B02100 [Naumovozyma dairenensis CBS 421]|uniref:2-methylcitrate dehydratase n=1 Tax=Naumovozyma dairenensis (strain ATCC 10597 / BCRC 20456 / CBS 421 / NBRC 0211 / NRRL Y-12639) TaxID=1071378 RepID=G0W634_NAUDC|nr:hypothetical protein NDAI_0B02100 [Naumovozyma dairenensis CBS 421]CCD23245.1 hypothetical protein NDAI_0B02100 [Naumovozyma dairenensis CBS 421]